MNGVRMIDAGLVLKHLVDAKLREIHVGEPVHYDLAPVPVAAPDGRIGAGYFLILSLRSPLLSPPRIASTYVIRDAYPTPDMIGEAVRTCLEALNEARKNLLRAGPGNQYHPSAN